MSTKSNPDTSEQIKQIHNKGIAVENQLYYERTDTGKLIIYRGTHEGRLKETTVFEGSNELIDDNSEKIEENAKAIEELEDRVDTLESDKADKCFAIAMSVAL